eukprot:485493-Rhodomonas_salina.1
MCLLAGFVQLTAMQEMRQFPDFVSEEWVHVLVCASPSFLARPQRTTTHQPTVAAAATTTTRPVRTTRQQQDTIVVADRAFVVLMHSIASSNRLAGLRPTWVVDTACA